LASSNTEHRTGLHSSTADWTHLTQNNADQE